MKVGAGSIGPAADAPGRAAQSGYSKLLHTALGKIVDSMRAMSLGTAPAGTGAVPSSRQLVLAQTSRSRVHRHTNRFSGNQQLHSAVLLPPRGTLVAGYRQCVAEPLRGNRTAGYAFLHQVIAH